MVRTTAAGLAARLDFTIDDIEDLRIAIGEATALAIPAADPGTDLVACFFFGPGALTVTLEAEAMDEPAARHGELRLAGARHDGAGRVGGIGGRTLSRPLHSDVAGRCGDDRCRALT